MLPAVFAAPRPRARRRGRPEVAHAMCHMYGGTHQEACTLAAASMGPSSSYCASIGATGARVRQPRVPPPPCSARPVTMAGAKPIALCMVLAILASNPLQAVANCKRKCITPCSSACVAAASARRRGQAHGSVCVFHPPVNVVPHPPSPLPPTPTRVSCCVKDQTPCTFFASVLGQNITINNACIRSNNPILPTQPWW